MTDKYNSELKINTISNFNQFEPSVSYINDNKFVITWTSDRQDGSGYGVYAQIFFNNGTKYNAEFQVNTISNFNQFEPSISYINDNKFVITWTSDRQDGSGYGVFAQIFFNNGTKYNSEFQVNTISNFNQFEPSISYINDNKFVITWTSDRQDGSGYGVFAQIFFNNGTKYNSEFQVNTISNFNQFEPSISYINDNKFVITWTSDRQDGSGYGVFAQIFFNNGTKYNSEFQVNTISNFNQFEPSISYINDNKFVITWTSDRQDGSGYGVFAQIFFNNGTKYNSEFQVNTISNFNQFKSSISYINDNKFIITWTSDRQDGSGYGVFAQIFFNNGTKYNSEFQVNTISNFNQFEPSVSYINDNKFIITWTSDSQDGSGYGVYAQIFYSNGTKYPYEEVTTTVAPTTLLVTTVVPTTTTITTPAPPPSTTTTTEMPTTTTLSPDTTAAPTTLIPPTAPVGVSPSSDAFNAQMDNSIFVSGIALCGMIMGEFLL